jgi:hypothetical protein
MTTGRQHALTFENKDGHRLFCIVHEPFADARRDAAILLLSPGVKNRIAPHRLYNKMAAQYAALGFFVLRFDFHGLGDSEGEVREPLLADLYGSIQVGRYCDDTRSAMDWMRRTFGIERFILGGLCGGAITGVLAGADDRSVVGIFGLGLPVMMDGANVDKVANMTAGQLRGMRERYLRKLLDPTAWVRLLTFKTNFRQLLRALRAQKRPARPPAPPPPGSNANPYFPPAFLQMLEDKRPVLLVFSGADRLYAEFQEKFLAYYHDRVAAHGDLLELVVVEDANHVFTFTAWQQEMLLRTSSWLQARFPPPARAVAPAASVAREPLSI